MIKSLLMFVSEPYTKLQIYKEGNNMLSFIPNHQEHCMIPAYPTNNIPAPNAEVLLQFLYTRQDYGANISGDDERVVLGVRITKENNIMT